MDIFNDFWTAINTNKISLINIFMAFFIESPLSINLIDNFLNTNLSKKQKLIYILSIGIIGIVCYLFISWPFNIILNYATAFIILFFILKLGFVKSFIATLFPSIIFNLVGYLLANPYLQILNITYEQTNTIPKYKIPFSFLTYFVVFLFNIIIKYRKLSLNVLENFDRKTKSVIILNFIFGFFCIFIQGILNVKYIDILPVQFTFFNFICLLLYFSISFYSVAKIIKLVSTTQKLESAEEYNKTLHILHDSVRGFKHDFDNIVTTIGGYIKTNDMKGLENYYSQLEEDCKKVNNLYLLNPDVINNHGIYNLLTTKYNEAIEKDIKVNITFLLDLNKLNMKIYEFARILGILLDNSIEAASECEEKIINLSFRNDAKNNRNIILIENTYKDKNINLDEIFEKGISGKEGHSGIGLWEINQILKKNNNVNLYCDANDKFFSQQLEIYY